MRQAGGEGVRRGAGEWVKCKVTDVDPPRGRISLSLRQTKPDPLKQSFATIIAPPEKGSTEVRLPLPRA